MDVRDDGKSMGMSSTNLAMSKESRESIKGIGLELIMSSSGELGEGQVLFG